MCLSSGTWRRELGDTTFRRCLSPHDTIAAAPPLSWSSEMPSQVQVTSGVRCLVVMFIRTRLAKLLVATSIHTLGFDLTGSDRISIKTLSWQLYVWILNLSSPVLITVREPIVMRCQAHVVRLNYYYQDVQSSVCVCSTKAKCEYRNPTCVKGGIQYRN